MTSSSKKASAGAVTDEAPEPKKPGRKKGSAKTGGRQKGTRNRNSLNVLTALDQANLPLIELLVSSIEELEPEKRVDKYFQLMGYCYPKLKEIEFTPPPASPAGDRLAPLPAPPETIEERIARIRNGHVARQPAASG